MNDDDVKKLVAATVAETLIRLGIDASDAPEMQADMIHLRRFRKSYEAASRQTILTAVGVVTAGFLGLIWMLVTKGN